MRELDCIIHGSGELYSFSPLSVPPHQKTTKQPPPPKKRERGEEGKEKRKRKEKEMDTFSEADKEKPII